MNGFLRTALFDRMKQLFVLAAAAAIVVTLGFDYAGAIDSFTARPDGDGITLEWRSQAESGIKSYTVERTDARTTTHFQETGTVLANGSYNYYKYHDGRVNSAPIAGGGTNTIKPLSDAYKYRLRMNLATGEVSYSQTVNVTRPSSGVRRTWGMIKEMFH